MKKVLLLLAFFAFAFNSFSQTHGKVIPIDSVQFVKDSILNLGKSDPTNFKYGDTVTVEGIVTFNPWYYGQSTSRKATWLQDTVYKAFGAINVFIEPVMPGYSGSLATLNNDVKFYENFVPGYRVKCTGRIADYTENTQLNLIPIESEVIDIPSKIDTTQIVKPITLNVDVFSKNDGSGNQLIMTKTAEPYEGYYVRFNNVTVVDASPLPPASRYYWSVQDSAGNKIQIRDNSGYFRNDHKEDAPWLKNYVFTPQTIGTRLEYIKGMIVQSSSSSGNVFMISPCLPTDIKVAAAAPYISKITRYPRIPKSTQTVKISAKITDNDGIIASAKLYYSVGLGNKNFTSISMTENTTTHIFTASIPSATNKQFVNFWIKATDNTGLVTNFPDTLASGSLYQVLDNGITSIADIQMTHLTNGNSLFSGDTLTGVNIGGIVTASLNQLPFVTIQSGNKPYSAIGLFAKSGDGLENLKRGDSITISSAIIIDSFNVTYLLNAGNTNFKLVSSGNPLPLAVSTLNPDSINLKKSNFTEPYELMLLEFKDVYVINKNADAPSNFGEWAFNFDSNLTSGLRVDDLSKYIEDNTFNMDSIELKQKMSYLRGLLYYSFGNWKLLPRDKNDIEGYFTADISNPESGNLVLTVYPNPVKESLNILGFTQNSEKLFIRIIDISGKTIMTRNFETEGAFNCKIDCSSLEKGLFIVDIISSEGKVSRSKLLKM